MSKYLTIAALAFLLTSCALGFGLWRSINANGVIRGERDVAVQALEQAEAARKRVEALLATARAEKAAQARKSAAQSEAISRAVVASPDWAGTPTPPAVAEALSGALEGLQ